MSCDSGGENLLMQQLEEKFFAEKGRGGGLFQA
jgi:hypothetical protein